jgi:hypothetical protein
MAKIRVFAPLLFCLICVSPFVCDGQSSKKKDLLKNLTKGSDEISYALFVGQPTPSKDLVNLLDRQAKWDYKKTDELNPTGMRLVFEKIKEQGTQPEGTPARYRVFVEGAPEHKVFSLNSSPVDKLSLDLTNDAADVYVNSQGLLMKHKPTEEQDTRLKSEDEVEVAPVTVTGEPMRYVFSSRDGQLQVYGTLVPHPLAAVEEGCRIEVRIAQPDATAVLIDIDGFPARTKVPVVIQSGDAGSINEELITNGEGHAAIAAFPYVPGKTEGKLKATAEGENCLPSVILPWGPLTVKAPAADAAPAAK